VLGTSLALLLRWAVLVSGLLLFFALAGGLVGGALGWLDGPLATVAHALRGPRLTAAMKLASLAGNGVVLTVWTVLAALTLRAAGFHRPALYVVVNAAGAGLLNVLLKLLFARPRPAVWARLSEASGYSFPSGHAMASAAIYGGIALAVSMRFPKLRIWGPLLGTLLVFVIGVSRVYLGVHYPSDVIAGWACGLSWALWLRPALMAKSSASAIARS